MQCNLIIELKRILIDFPERCNYHMNESHRAELRKYMSQAISCDAKYLFWLFPKMFDKSMSVDAVTKTLNGDIQWLFLRYDDIISKSRRRDGQDHHAYHENQPCARIFRRGEPIYKCLTCGFDETCALCSNCYQEDQHEGHVVNISICQRENGGVCDCGDPEAWVGSFTCRYARSNNTYNVESSGVPPELQKAFESTVSILLDYVIDVMSRSDLQLSTPQNHVFDPEEHSNLCSLRPQKYGFSDSDEFGHGRPCESYALIAYNDQVRHFRDAVQRIHLASKKVSEFAIMVAEQVQTHGRATVLRSKDVLVLVERQKVLGATGFVSCIRNIRDEFRENMCHDILAWLGALTNRDFFKTNEVLKDLFCFSFCCRWQPGLLNLVPYGSSQYVKGKLSLNSEIPNPVLSSLIESSALHWNFVPSLWNADPDLCRQCDYNQSLTEYSSSSFRGSRFQYLVYFDIRFWKSIRGVLHDFYLTSLITNLKFKKLFACQYVDIYPVVADLFLTVDGEPELNILSKLSSQLFTCPSHSMSIISHGDVSRMFLTIFNFLRSGQVFAETIKSENERRLSLVSLKNRRWGQIFFDISYILGRGKDKKLIQSDGCIPMVCDILSLFQGKPVLRREKDHHVEYESTEYTAFFHAILVVYQFAEYISQSITNLEIDQRKNISRSVIAYVTSHLLDLELIGIQKHHDTDEVDYGRVLKNLQTEGLENCENARVSFLHPLHSFLSWLIEHSNFSSPDQLYSIFRSLIEKLLPKMPELIDVQTCINAIFKYPIRTVVLSSQIQCGFWVRNGFSVRSQLQLYKNTSLREQGYLRDLFLVQVFTVLSDPDAIMEVFLKDWRLYEWANELHDSSTNCAYESNILPYILEEFFSFFIYILTEDSYLKGVSTEVTTRFQIKNEIIHNLCFGPLSYSNLCSQIPEHINSEKSFDSVLDELATFKAPMTLKDTGMYMLKDEFFDQVDPYYFNYTINKKEDAIKLLKDRIKEANDFLGCDVVISPKHRDVESFGMYKYIANFSTSTFFIEFLIKVIRYLFLEGVNKLDGLLETVLHLIHVCSLEDLIDPARHRSFFAGFVRRSANFLISLCSALYEMLTNVEFSTHHSKIRAIFKTLRRKHDDLLEVMKSTINEFRADQLDLVVNKSLGESRDERKKRLAKLRQAKLLAKFKKQQSLFSKMNNVENDCSDLEMEEEEESEGWKFPEPHCILCQDTAENAGPFGIISYVSKAAEFRQVPFDNKFWFLKAFSDLTNLSAYTCTDGISELHSNDWTSYMDLIKHDHVVGPGFTDQRHIRNKLVSLTCGHGMHFHCYMQYLSNNKSRLNQITRNNPDSAEHREFLCPLCKAINNMFVPILWSANNRSLSKFLYPVSDNRNPFSALMQQNLHDKSWIFEFCRKTTQNLKTFSLLTNLAKEMIGLSTSDEALENQQQFRLLLTNMFQILSLLTFPHLFRADCPKNLINSIKSTEISLRGTTHNSNFVIHQLSNNTLINLRALNEFRLTSLLMKFSNCVPSQTGQISPHVKYLSSLQTLSPENFNNSVIYSDFFELLVTIFPASSTSFDFNSILVSCFLGSIMQNLRIIVTELITHEFFRNESYSILDIPYSMLLSQSNASIAVEAFKSIRSDIPIEKRDESIVNHPKFGFVVYSMLLKSITPFLRRSAIYAYICCADLDVAFDSSSGIESDSLCVFLKIPTLSEMLEKMVMGSKETVWEAERLLSFRKYIGDVHSKLHYKHFLSPMTMEYPGMIRLAELPERLDQFFTEYFYLEKFHNPHLRIENPAICLFCAKVLDAQSRAIGSSFGQCSTHFTKECMSSVGIYLLPKDRCMLLLHKNGGIFHEAPYLDNHGELPADAKKGRPVHLLKLSYEEFMRNAWLQHNVPNLIVRKLDSVVDVGGWDTL